MTTGYLVKEDGDDCNSQSIKGRLCLLYMLLFEDVICYSYHPGMSMGKSGQFALVPRILYGGKLWR